MTWTELINALRAVGADVDLSEDTLPLVGENADVAVSIDGRMLTYDQATAYLRELDDAATRR